MKPVRDDGSLAAKIIAIGECPGAVEEGQGRPFVGPAGKVLTRWWAEAGLSRPDVYLTNVYPFRAPGDKIENVNPAALAAYANQLHDRLAALDAPRILVPLGNTALQAVLGFGSITKHRGYFYEYTDRRGRVITVIPSIHPAATLYQAGRRDTTSIFATEQKAQRSWAARCILDWKRIAAEAKTAATILPERKQYVLPTLDDVHWLHSQVKQLHTSDVLAWDVETPRERIERPVGVTKAGKPKVVKEWGDPYLACIAFSYDPTWAMSVPTTVKYWKSQARWQEVRQLLREMLMARCMKATQNGHFDWFWGFFELDVWPFHWQWDTLALDHMRDPIEQHSLEFQGSIHLRTQYWKDEAKESDEITQIQARHPVDFYAYNCKDGHHTRELVDVHINRPGFDPVRYHEQYQALFLPIFDMMVRGMRVDDGRRRWRLAHLMAQAITLRTRLTELAGEDLYGKVAISPPKLAKFLYQTLGLPKQYTYAHGKREKKVTTNEVAIRRLAVKYPTQFGEAGDCILDARRVGKKQEFYEDGLADPDGYTRCQYGLTETLRLKSWANPRRRGRNHQNFDRECRDHIVPDPGHLWLQPDASQVESRICYVMTGDPHLIEIARRHPADYDDHRVVAQGVLGTEQIGYLERQVGKITGHAAQRDMKGPTLADTLLKMLGVVRAPEECQMYIDNYHALRPAIKGVYFRECRHRVIHDKRLTNSWGFTIYLHNEPLDDTLYRRAYSFYMQSENGMNTNYLALVPTYWWLLKNKMRTRIVQQGHDSLGMSAHPDEVYDVMRQVQSTWEVPRVYWGTELTVPICWTIGTSYGQAVHEFKRFPSREEVEEVVQQCLGSSSGHAHSAAQ